MGGAVSRSIVGVAVAISTGLVVVFAAVAVFLNPLWVGFEQARTGADKFTGYTLDDVRRVTNAVLGELIFGPATFLQQVGGSGVFDPREQQHLADVRGVLLGFFGLVVAAVLVLILAGWRVRDRGRLWRSVAWGASVLGVAVVVVGAVFALFFDAAFDLFHRLLFAGGSYTFDPLHERLVQLFPEDFWSETSIALAVVILVLCAAVAWIAVRRAAAAGAMTATAPLAAMRREGVT